MKASKHGKPRKSPRPRLPSSSFTGRSEFKLTVVLQTELEKALGVSFSAADASALTRIINQYFGREPFEGAAPHYDDAAAYLQKLQDCAGKFAVTLGSAPEIADAAAHVQRLIMRQYPRRERLLQPWEHVLHLAYDFQRACTRAAEELKAQKNKGFVEGEAWRKMIGDLTAFCKKRAWPTGVAKDPVYKSRFRDFIMKLQKSFPANLQRHISSEQALATAIIAARSVRPGSKKGERKSS